MRLTETQIADGFTHEKQYVRDSVIDYFRKGQHGIPDITERVLQAVRKFGWKEAFEWPNLVADFPLNPEQAEWIIGELQKNRFPRDSHLPQHLAFMLARSPVETLRAHQSILSSMPQMDASFPAGTARQQMLERLAIWEMSALECWNLLQRHCDSLTDLAAFSDANIPYAETLIQRIASEGLFCHDEVLRILRETRVNFDDGTGWRVGCMAILAGKLKMEEAIPGLFGLFQYDWDWYNEEVMYALCRIGSVGVLKYVAERYSTEEWYVRNFSGSVFEEIHHPDVFDYLLPLIKSEKDDGLRVKLAVAATDHFDDRGFETAESVFVECPQDPEREVIREKLLSFAELAHQDFPEKTQWEREVLAEKERLKKRRALIDAEFFDDLRARPIRADQPDDTVGTTIGSTLFRDPATVGRNDPCPCGSGRKYKKCCLKVTPFP